MKHVIFLILFVSASLAETSCRKEIHATLVQDELHLLANNPLEIDEAAIVFDSTALSDSPYFAYPPTNRVYQWKVLPDGSTATISNDYKHGKAGFAFSRSGHYSVSADIYDSASGHLIGKAGPMGVDVSTDTLHQFERIRPNERLICLLSTGWFGRFVVDSPSLNIAMYTAGYYDGYGRVLDFTVDFQGNAYCFDISDSARLYSYPFASDLGQYQAGTDWNVIDYITPNVPVNLHIIWLNATYSGSITPIKVPGGYYKFNINWPDTSAVVLRQ